MPNRTAPTRSPRRTRVEQAEFYEHLVQTSLQLFSDGGYEAVSMRRLAQEVGVPPMTLYRYFPTKAHLIRHVWDHILYRAHERAIMRLARCTEPFDRLRAFVDDFLEYWFEHKDHYWVVFAIRDSMGGSHAEENAYALGPNPQRFLQTLEILFDECVPPAALSPSDRKQSLDLIVIKALGLLLGTIGVATLQWTNVVSLKNRLLDEIVDQVRSSAAGLRKRNHSRSNSGALSNSAGKVSRAP